MIDWLKDNPSVVFWLLVLSVGSLVLTAILLPVVVVRLPADYFVTSAAERRRRPGRRGVLWRLAKNALGAIFLVSGTAMLVLPGQGILTMFMGLILIEFPGKFRLERALVGRPRVLRTVNRVRARFDRPPLQIVPGTKTKDGAQLPP